MNEKYYETYGYKSNKNIVWKCLYHVVWTSKYRRPVLTGVIEHRLKEIIEQQAKEYDVELISYEVMPDHVHILVEVDPQFGINTFVKRLKGRSSHDLRTEFPSLRSRLPTLWSNSYFVSTVGGAPLSVVKHYIENQRNV